jgi:DeoR/GlpR family transcriptional regulator of sugar metabolism
LAPVKSISVILLGGRVRGGSLATVDHWAIDMLSDLVLDLAFLGTNGISRDRGLTTPDPAVSAVKHKVVQVSRRRILVAVHTKFGVNSFCRFADVADFETLITDVGLSTQDAHRYTALGPAVIRA